MCRQVLLSHDIPGNPANLKLLYDFVAQSDSVEAMSLLISMIKSAEQIVAKLAHLKKYYVEKTDNNSNDFFLGN